MIGTTWTFSFFDFCTQLVIEIEIEKIKCLDKSKMQNKHNFFLFFWTNLWRGGVSWLGQKNKFFRFFVKAPLRCKAASVAKNSFFYFF